MGKALNVKLKTLTDFFTFPSEFTDYSVFTDPVTYLCDYRILFNYRMNSRIPGIGLQQA